ncbi:hypothetical protein CBL_12417 [Carabus blaptoides fortunei]
MCHGVVVESIDPGWEETTSSTDTTDKSSHLNYFLVIAYFLCPLSDPVHHKLRGRLAQVCNWSSSGARGSTSIYGSYASQWRIPFIHDGLYQRFPSSAYVPRPESMFDQRVPFRLRFEPHITGRRITQYDVQTTIYVENAILVDRSCDHVTKYSDMSGGNDSVLLLRIPITCQSNVFRKQS